MKNLKTFEVMVDIPEGVTSKQMAQYIVNAISHWRDYYEATNPLHQLDRTAVAVSYEEVTEDENSNPIG